MKRRTAAGSAKTQAENTPDMDSIIGKMMEHLLVLERKLDTLISRTSERPLEVRFSNPYQRIGSEEPAHRGQQQPAQVNAHRPNNQPRERVMHKATCADCQSACEVPFKPSGDRPVYCKECYAKRRNGGGPRTAHQPKPEHIAHAQKRHPGPAPVTAAAAAPARVARKPAEKKKREARKRK